MRALIAIARRAGRRLATLTLVAALLLALGLGERAADAAPSLPVRAHRGRVTVLAERGLDALARTLADEGDAALDDIARDLPDLTPPRAVEIHLVVDAATLPEVAPAGEGAPPWAVGVAYPERGVVSIASRRGATIVDAEATLRHELSPVALGVALGPRVPHWLQEGFAFQHAGEWSWDRTETLAGMAWLGGLIELDELDRSFPAAESPANRAYAQSSDFVGFLSRRGRWEDHDDDGDRWPFRRFLGALGRGASLDDAAIRAYGRPLHALYEEWRSDLGNRYLLMPIGLLGLVAWVLVALLLMVAWWRRRRQNRRRLAVWGAEERARDAARARAREEARARGEAVPAAPRGDPPEVAGERLGRLGEPDEAHAEADEDEAPSGDPPRWLN
jgi:hypothetical protein